jgi:GLPGLI family protein
MNSFLISLVLFIFSGFYSFSQISEGRISYSIKINVTNPDMAMVAGMLDGSKMELYFSKNQTRSELNMGMIMNITTISDADKDSLVMLMGGMMGKKAIKTSIAEMTNKMGTDSISKLQLLEETKKILDYTCKKALLIDGSGNRSEFWYTNDIQVSKLGQTYLNADIPGFPMEFELNNNGVNMKLIATEFVKDLSVSSHFFFIRNTIWLFYLTKRRFIENGILT